MISFLFWNLAGNEKTIPCVARLALTYTVDLFLLAECPQDQERLVAELNAVRRGTYRISDAFRPKVVVISRLPAGSLTPRFTGLAQDVTIWKLKAGDPSFVLLAAAHLPA